METNKHLTEYPQLLKIFLHYLRAPTLVQCTTESDRQIAQFGAACFEGMFTVFQALETRRQNDPGRDSERLLIGILTDSWPDIWKWMKFLYWVGRDIFTLLSPSAPGRFRAFIVRMLCPGMYREKTTFMDTVLATPEVFTMLVDLWVELSELEFIEEKWQFDPSSVAVTIAKMIGEDPTRIRKFVDLMGGDKDRIATLILKNLHQALSFKVKNAVVLGFERILMFNSMITATLPGLHHALLSQNSMVIITRTFGRISSMRGVSFERTSPTPLGNYTRPNDEPFNPHRATVTCALYLWEAFSTSGGFTWITQAIRSGVIPAILRSACRDMEQTDDHLLANTIKTITPYLVYRSVLRVVSKAFQDPIIQTLESKLPRDREFYGVWFGFRIVANVRLFMKEQFDASGEYTQGCSSPMVCIVILTIGSYLPNYA